MSRPRKAVAPTPTEPSQQKDAPRPCPPDLGIQAPITPGNIVHCRHRDWVLLPSNDPDLYLLRPLTGATDGVVAIHKGLANLIGLTLPEENVRSAEFPPPTVNDLADATGAHL